MVDAMSAVCGSCHAEISTAAAAGGSTHLPVAEGTCTACHLPHRGMIAGLLPDTAPRLCLTCHADLGKRMASGHVHPPAADGECLECHEPHHSAEPMLLAEAVPDQCLGCHDGEEQAFRDHHLGRSGESLDCRKCHDPHASQDERLLQAVAHDPFAQGACEVCHPGAAPGDAR
jgi:predicted CXXCH cytochrome family protein